MCVVFVVVVVVVVVLFCFCVCVYILYIFAMVHIFFIVYITPGCFSNIITKFL